MKIGRKPATAPPALARFVVTVPQAPSKFETALTLVAPEGAPALTATTEAFLYLARRSKVRLVVITPFIDLPGILWAITLFQVSSAPQRVLVVRNRSQLDNFPIELSELKRLDVSILEYRIYHPVGTRSKPIETFHAKIVMSDGSAAYVGSANLVESSQEVALECGFVIEGPAVAQVLDVVEAILRIASG